LYCNNLYSALSQNLIRSNDAVLVSNLKDVIKHITVCLTSYPWKQSRILCYAVLPFSRRDCYSFMTGSAGVRNQSLIAFFPKRWRSNPLHPASPLTRSQIKQKFERGRCAAQTLFRSWQDWSLALDLAGICKTLRLFFAANLALEREQEGHSLMTPVETAWLFGLADADAGGLAGSKEEMGAKTFLVDLLGTDTTKGARTEIVNGAN
jgi:hypothetical protein